MKPTESVPGVVTLVDERGLTPKAKRIEAIAQIVSGVNRVMQKRLGNLHLSLQTDPALIITESYYDKLTEVLPKLLKNLLSSTPFNQELLLRSATFDQLFDLRLPTASVTIGDKKTEDLIPEIRKQITSIQEPEQIIIHPRSANKEIRDNMIALRITSIPGDIRIECGMKGIDHVVDLNQAEFYQSISISDLALDNLYEPFIPFVRGAVLCNPIIDKLIAQVDSRVTTYHTPVYEYKCFMQGEEGVMIWVDYDLP